MNYFKKRGSMGTRAQITVFMIVGIILLFSSALLFYIRGQVTQGISEEFIPTIENVPLEAQPIKVFVEDCLRKVATEGIMKMGAHGGYINPVDRTYGSVFNAGLSPTDSDALRMLESSNVLVPYWWYMSSPNDCRQDCQFNTNRPALYKTQTGERSIEGQLDTYLKKNLPACLEDFSIFREQGFTVEKRGELSPDFKVTERDALVILTYPIRASKEGKSTDMTQFFTRVDVSLKQVYELATDITNSELAFNFLEKHALNLIAMYSKPVGTDRLPPTGYFSFGPGEYLIWTTSQTRDRMESYVLPPGIAMLQIIGTSNYQRHAIFDPELGKYDRVATGIMDKTLITLNSSIDYPLMQARMAYLDWWPIYLNINDAEILKPSEIGPAFVGPLFDLLGMSMYKFRYDVSFPVLITLTDTYAFQGKGFKFNFALEGNIRNNVIVNSSFAMLPRAPAESYFCDENMRNSGMITVNVDEKYTGVPVEHARVDFIAGDELCFIGYAEKDEKTGTSVLSARFPIGSGEIKISKDGYLPVKKQFGAFLDKDASYKYSLMPITTINATVVPVVLLYSGQGKYALPQIPPPASLDPRDKAMFAFTRIDDDGFGDFDTFLSYNITEGPASMLLVPGKYEVAGHIISYKSFRIPKETKTFSVPFKKDKVIEINESVFDSFDIGGVEFNNVTGYLEISRDDLVGSSLVRFKALRFPLPMTHSREVGIGSDLEQVGQHELYTNIYRHELMPEWVK
jgi:hypothetical protein